MTLVLRCFTFVLIIPLVASAVSAVTQEQIEADWMRQRELRALPGQVTVTVNDAAGGCDGIIDGKWGFHTNHEKQPLVAGGFGRANAA